MTDDFALTANDACMLVQSRSFERAKIAQHIRERCVARDYMFTLHSIAHVNVLDEVLASDEVMFIARDSDDEEVHVVRDSIAQCYVAFDSNYFFRVIVFDAKMKMFVSYDIETERYVHRSNLFDCVAKLQRNDNFARLTRELRNASDS